LGQEGCVSQFQFSWGGHYIVLSNYATIHTSSHAYSYYTSSHAYSYSSSLLFTRHVSHTHARARPLGENLWLERWCHKNFDSPIFWHPPHQIFSVTSNVGIPIPYRSSLGIDLSLGLGNSVSSWENLPLSMRRGLCFETILTPLSMEGRPPIMDTYLSDTPASCPSRSINSLRIIGRTPLQAHQVLCQTKTKKLRGRSDKTCGLNLKPCLTIHTRVPYYGPTTDSS
jgi:hypothetical protein